MCPAPCPSSRFFLRHSSASLEVLHGALVLPRGLSRGERAQVAPLARARVLLPRVQAVAAGWELADHRPNGVQVTCQRRYHPAPLPIRPPGLEERSAMDWGLANRLARILRPDTGRTVMLAVDHGYFLGPT